MIGSRAIAGLFGRPRPGASRREPSSAELAELLAVAYRVVLSLDAEGRIESVLGDEGPRLGLDAGERAGRDPLEWVHPDQREEVSAALQGAGPVPRILEVSVLSGDGSRQRIEVTVVRPTVQGRTWILCRESPRSNDPPGPRRDWELEAITWRAGRIVHQMNNLLHVVRGHAESRAAAGVDAGPDRRVDRDALRHIAEAAEHGAALASQLRELAEGRSAGARVIDVGQELTRRREALEAMVRLPVDVLLDPDADRLFASADLAALELALASLLLDLSRRAGKTAKLQLRALLCDDGTSVAIELRAGKPAGPQDERHFQTLSTRGSRRSEGRHGLAFVIELLAPHEARLALETGSPTAPAYRVLLPRAPTPAMGSDEDPAGPSAEPAPARQTVLVVDDAEEIRRLVARILGSRGYRVLEAACGESAEDRLREHDGPIDLLLVDMILAQESGLEVRDRIGEMQPGIRSLFMSGFPDVLGLPAGFDGSEPEVLAKPFDGDRLVLAVRRALDLPE